MPQEGRSCEEILSAAREAEKLGFDSVWVYDHLFMSRANPYPECWTLLSALAIETQRVKIGPLVLNNLLRQPSLVAKMGTTLDQLSRGRFELGIGAGWYQEECELYGIVFPPFTERMRRLAESVEIILKLWKSMGKPVSFQGKYYKLKDAICLPPPYRKPHPPIFLGGKSTDTLRIVAKHALGLNVDQDWGIGLAEIKKILDVLNYLCHQEGTDPKRVSKSMCVRLFTGFEEDNIKKQLIEWSKEITFGQSLTRKLMRETLHVVRSILHVESLKYVPPTSQIIGSPKDCISQLLEYYELGVNSFYIKLYDFTDFDLLSLVANDIIRPLKG
ncbi:MAG: LLM class flavin-dependent oxidoreductase [Candidatus Bathycorpusculaceae bacterium]